MRPLNPVIRAAVIYTNIDAILSMPHVHNRIVDTEAMKYLAKYFACRAIKPDGFQLLGGSAEKRFLEITESISVEVPIIEVRSR